MLFVAGIPLLFAACETDEFRVRQGIHDPIERHQKKSWNWPFRQPEEPKRPKPRPPEEDTFLPDYQPLEMVEPG